jgi:aspartate/methionine/tyrosine aminotransferase
LIILNLPLNPTGTAITMQEKRNLVGLETEFYLCLLCEETYQDAKSGEGMLSKEYLSIFLTKHPGLMS